jgi:serine/threonine protein kinase
MDALLQLKESLAERYDIKREIGAGGMATVYLAQDIRHDRPVALKLLNPELGAVLGVERFLAEIRVTANLQHPNLLPLFDSGAADGLLYYVMPFVEGESLRARLTREKQLPVDEAVRITVAIANALEYAHSHGVIHRDLKPENILLQAGQPVIADFGIALAVSNAGGNRITQTGLSLGTPQYMSPEQATGDRVIDGRSDIYSLGAVAYEMLTGEPPHTGTTSQAIIARMLTEKPRPMRVSRSAIPEHVELAVQHALEKLPADRFSKASEFAEAIQGRGTIASTEFYSSARPRRSAPDWKSRLRDPITIGLSVVALGALGFASMRKAPTSKPLPVFRFVVSAPDSMRPGQIAPWPGAISPDGGTVVYAPVGTRGLVALRLDQLEPRVIPGTARSEQVIFSPDGEWIGFEGGGKFRKARLDGSAPIAVTDAFSENGADWTSRDEIIFGSEGKRHGLSRVSASGGELAEFAKPDSTKGELDYLWPIATPDGKSAVFAVWGGSLASSKLATASIDDGQVSYLGVKGVRPLAVIDHQLIYVQLDGAVVAVELNRSATKTAGSPVPVLDPVYVYPGTNGNSEIFISRNGALLTSRGGALSQLEWIAPNGVTTPVANETQQFGPPSVSPDGKSFAVAVEDQGKSDVWIYDLVTKGYSRLGAADLAASPHWSRDGTKVYYIGLDEKQRYAGWVQSVDGGTPARKLFSTHGPTSSIAVAPDEKSFAYSDYSNNSFDLWGVTLDSLDKETLLAGGISNEVAPVISPDGHWIAYESDRTGRSEVYVRSYPNVSISLQVSAAGGREPVWSPDGKRVFYRTGSSLLQARLSPPPSVRVMARDTVIKNMQPIALGALAAGYSVAPDGKILGRVINNNAFQLVVVPNWKTELDERLAKARH